MSTPEGEELFRKLVFLNRELFGTERIPPQHIPHAFPLSNPETA
jgi:hypothetical protein